MIIWNRVGRFRLLAIALFILSAVLLIAGCSEDGSSGDPSPGAAGSDESTGDGPTSDEAVAEEEGDQETAAQDVDVQFAGNFEIDRGSLEIYEGLSVGFTEDGYPFRGDPKAPITLIEYSDYLCPFCGRYFDQTLPSLLETYGQSGQVNFIFRDFPLASLHPTAPVGHAAALCVAEQGALLFWQMHDALFSNQGQWNSLGDPSDYVSGLAEEIGVDMDAFEACMDAGSNDAQVTQSVNEIMAMGFGGTPSFQVINGRSGQTHSLVGAQPLTVFANVLDTLLAGEQLAETQTEAAEASLLSEEERGEASQVTFDFDEELETYNGLPAGFTEEGYPFLGNPEAAVSLVEFSDYLCPFCGRHFNQTTPGLIEKYGPSGEVNFVFRDFPLASLHPTAHYGHEGALCVGEQGAAIYWAMHDGLFSSQQQWANLPDPTEYVAELAESLGADMAAYEECLAAGEVQELVQERVAEGSALGFSGTPTFQVINNESGAIHEVIGAQPADVFYVALDAMVAGEPVPEPEAPPPPELPFWANADGLAPDPDRPGYNLAGDPYKGDPDAPVVMVEFSDFQCPACQQHAQDVQPALDEQFVETGQVMWVYKNFPLGIHPQALVAAVAAECAGEQERFWEMHHLLFENVDAWAEDDVDAELAELAEEAGLDLEAFSACYDGREALERIVADMYDAQGAIQSTPTFVLLQGGRGTLLNGSRQAEAFAALLQSVLDQEAGTS